MVPFFCIPVTARRGARDFCCGLHSVPKLSSALHAIEGLRQWPCVCGSHQSRVRKRLGARARKPTISTPCPGRLGCSAALSFFGVCAALFSKHSRLCLCPFCKRQTVPSSPHFPSDPSFTRFSTADASPLPGIPENSKDTLPFPTCQWLPNRGVHVSERRTYGFNPNVVDVERFEFLSNEGCLPQHLFRSTHATTCDKTRSPYCVACLSIPS